MEKEWKIAGASFVAGILAGLGIAYLIDKLGNNGDGNGGWSPSTTTIREASNAGGAQAAREPDGGPGI